VHSTRTQRSVCLRVRGCAGRVRTSLRSQASGDWLRRETVSAHRRRAPTYQPQTRSPKRIDSEYARHGSVNLFGWVEPLTGKREVWVTERRTAVDYAHALKRVSEAFPEADVIVIVQGPSAARTQRNNLNTHSKAALYQAFEAPEAHRLAHRFKVHFTELGPTTRALPVLA
jgi:hypothetical protein